MPAKHAVATAADSSAPRILLIGQLAKISGRSEHTIRWYEAQRLIPGVRRDLKKRRTYTRGHIDWLDLLDRLRRTGMTIRELREYTELVKRGDGTLKERQSLMREHRKRIEASIQDLQESLQIIDGKIDFYGMWLETGERPSRRMGKRA